MHEMPAASNAIIEIRNVSKNYVSRNFGPFGKKEIKPILHNINLDIARGEIFGLAGESGSGKSTLARCILGLVDYEGEITIDYRVQLTSLMRRKKKTRSVHFPIHEMHTHEMQARILQPVFQDPGASLNPVKNIGWLLEEPLVIHRLGTALERSRRVDEMLFRIGLDPLYRKRRPRELSGGQKQRICIGRALMLEPKILIADEAISSLDVSAGAQILNLFSELRQNLGLTILFITHNMDAAEYLCDRVAVMKEGRLVVPTIEKK